MGWEAFCLGPSLTHPFNPAEGEAKWEEEKMVYEEGEKPKEIILGSILVVIGFNALLLGIAFLPLESIDFLFFFLLIGLGIGVVGAFLPNLKLTKNTIAYIKSTIPLLMLLTSIAGLLIIGTLFMYLPLYHVPTESKLLLIFMFAIMIPVAIALQDLRFRLEEIEPNVSYIAKIFVGFFLTIAGAYGMVLSSLWITNIMIQHVAIIFLAFVWGAAILFEAHLYQKEGK